MIGIIFQSMNYQGDMCQITLHFSSSSGKGPYSEVLKCTPKVFEFVITEVRTSDVQVPEVEVEMQPVCNVLPSKEKKWEMKKKTG